MKKRILICVIMVLAFSLLGACSNSEEKGSKGPYTANDALLSKTDSIENEEEILADGTINILSVVLSVDTTSKKITVKTILDMDRSDYNYTQRTYQLTYTGGTDIKNSYGTIISASQIIPGQVVEVIYNTETDKVEKIHESGDVWVSKNITGVTPGVVDNTISYGKNVYKYSDTTVVLDNGQEIEIKDIDPNDVITIRGNDKEIYSITLDKGHGYLKLSGYTQFLDGYIEIGDNRVLKITKDMVITVTEGTFKVILSNGGVTAVRNITIERDKTVVASFEEYLQDPNKQGSVKFALSPSTAKMYIDGVKIDPSKSVELEYGIHTMTVVATGYDTYIETFVVDSIYMELEIDLDGIDSEEKTTESKTESKTEKDTQEDKEESTTKKN